MFDVIFINPLDKKEEGKEFFSLFSRLKKIRLLPPLGLAYLASFLREAGFKVKIIDANALRLNQEDLRRIIASDKPKIVAVTSTTPVFNSSLNVCKLVKDIDTKIITVMGGVHITVMPFETLQFHSCIDYGIIRDGEIPLLELTKRLIKKADVSGIPGLVYRDANVNVRLNPNDTLIDDLDKIPFPAWDMLPVERYFDVTCKSYHTVSLVSSRGCPFKCAFCERDVRGGHLRKRSAGNFVDEIELLLKNYGFKELLFYDDTFTVDKKRVIEICAEIKKRKLSFHWDCRTRSDMISPEIAKLMKEAGCRRISLGIESADQKVLNALNKGITPQQAALAVKAVKDAGMEVLAYFMLGSPGESQETLKRTFKFSLELEPDFAYYSITVGYPGTDLLDAALKSGATPLRYWPEYVKNAGILPGPLPYFQDNGLNRSFIDSFQKRAYMGFYLSPKFILNSLKKIRSLRDLFWYGRMARACF